MRLLRRRQKGHLHVIAPIIVMVSVGLVGTYLLVQSHAQSLPPEGAARNVSYYYTSCPRPHATVKKGSSSSGCVKYLQWSLDQPGAGTFNLKIDGAFGPATDTAVKVFQGRHSLTKDGIVGPKTWSALDAANAPSFRYSTLTASHNNQYASIYACKLGSYMYFKAYGGSIFSTSNWVVYSSFSTNKYGSNLVSQYTSPQYAAYTHRYLSVLIPAGHPYALADIRQPTGGSYAFAIGETLLVPIC